MKRIYIGLFCGLSALLPSSCNKVLDAGVPSTELTGQSVFSNAQSATAALMDVYTQLASNMPKSFCVNLGMAADELVSFSNPVSGYYTNIVTALSGPDPCWGPVYMSLYAVNRVIQGVSSSSSIDSAMKAQLLGESYFLRAWQCFYLVNLYGDIPYTTSSDYTTNNSLSRTPKAQVYANIIADLKQAQSLLTDSYLQPNNLPNGKRTRANKAAATALLARVYLFQGDWTDAATQASTVIADATYHLEPNLANVFLIASNESIWDFAPPLVQSQNNTSLALDFVLTGPPANNYNAYVALAGAVYNSFDAGDQRKTTWVGTYTNTAGSWNFPRKYKNNVMSSASTEYTVVLRLAEQYLIRAEALAQQNQVAAAVQDLNTIRARAGAPLLDPAMSQSDCFAAVAKERQSELFTEWGSRWLDLKRTGQSTAVLGQIAAKTWTAKDTLFPIPYTQLQFDPNMTQNPGF